jgi:hypothetical protein
LIQKYGSLGGALDAFIGKTITATDIQNKLNAELEDSVKSSTGEIANLNNLVSILTSVNSTRSQQIGAFDELNKKYPGLLANINAENASSEASIKLLSTRLELYKTQILLEGRREALTKLVGESAYEGEKAIASLTNRKNLGFFDKFGLELRGLFAGIGGLGVINVLNQDLGNAVASSDSYSKSLEELTQQLTGVNGEISLLIKNQKDEAAAAKKAAQEAAKKVKEPKKKKTKSTRGQITEGEEINNGVITSDLELLSKVTEANIRITNAAVDKIRRYRDSQIKDQGPLSLIPDKISKIGAMPMSKELSDSIGQIRLQLEETAQKFATTRQALEDVFFNPLNDLFTNFLDTGKFAFKEFGKAVLATIKQLIAKIIATGLINLLASILVPGGAQATSLLGGGGGVGGLLAQAFGGAVKSVLGIKNNIANPTFAGIGGGGMQMSGQVVFVQRGSDLVGVLNRTNGTINRVG